MRKRKHKKTFAKLGLLFIILLISLASISMSYSAWTDTLTISGTITTLDDLNYPYLEGYWKFDENTGQIAYDSSFNTNDGQLGSTPVSDDNDPTWTTGHSGTDAALDFDGSNDYVGMGDVIDFERTDTYTLAAWISTTMTAPGAIIAKMNIANSYKGYDMILESGSIEAHLINNWAADNAIKVEASTLVNDGAWHHIAVTYDGSSSASGLKIYIDGNQETTTIAKDSLSGTTINSDELRVGTRVGHIPFNGKIDEVKIYSCALDASEILAEYQAGL